MAIYYVGTSNAFNTTTASLVGSGDSSITLTTAATLQAPGVIVIDRVNSNNVSTPTVREYISFTGISTNTLTGCSRGLGGSSAQSHAAGAVVEECLSVTHWNGFVTALLNVLTAAGVLDTTKVVDLTTAQTLTNKTLTSPTTTGTDSGTATISNKRRTRRVATVTQSATPTVNSDNTDVASITGLAQAITSMTTNLSGTPNAGDQLEFQITDNGTARAITWGASFESTGNVTLPTTTVISAMLRVGFEWNTAASKWDCIAVA
jgi:hypothetical protein